MLLTGELRKDDRDSNVRFIVAIYLSWAVMSNGIFSADVILVIHDKSRNQILGGAGFHPGAWTKNDEIRRQHRLCGDKLRG